MRARCCARRLLITQRASPAILRAAVRRGSRHRWTTLLSVPTRDALAASLIEEGVALLDAAQGPVLSTHEVLLDLRVGGPGQHGMGVCEEVAGIGPDKGSKLGQRDVGVREGGADGCAVVPGAGEGCSADGADGCAVVQGRWRRLRSGRCGRMLGSAPAGKRTSPGSSSRRHREEKEKQKDETMPRPSRLLRDSSGACSTV